MSLGDNIRAYYKLEDANDAYGANTLTNDGGVTFATGGKNNNSAGVFTTTKRLSVPNAMGFTSTNSSTHAFWIKFTAVGGYIYDNFTTSGANKRQLLYCGADKLVLFLNATDNAITTGVASISTGVWYHVIVTKSGSNYELFLNNSSKGTAVETGTAGGANYFSIGNTADGVSPWGAPINGQIDEFVIYDRVLDGTERADLYNSGTGFFYPFPPQVTQSAATSITVNSAIANGIVTSDNGATITERGFVYSTLAAPTLLNSKVIVSGTVGSYSADIVGLPVGTTYYVRAYATNARGTSYSNEISFTTANIPQYNLQKDLSADEGDTFIGQINVTGTLGTITVKLGSAGTSTVINAGAGISAFSGTYSGLSGLIITRSATFNGTIDNVYYAKIPLGASIDWSLNTVALTTPIASEVFFKRVEDTVFNSFRFYRYLDLLFKDLDGYVTVTVRQEREDNTTEKTKTFSVGNIGSGTVSPFQKKRISFLCKDQAIIIGLSNANLNETFSIAQYLLLGDKKPRRSISPSKIISV